MITFVQLFSRDEWMLERDTLPPEVKSITKFFGGRDLMYQSRYHPKYFYWLWIVEFIVREENREKVTKIVNDKGYQVQWIKYEDEPEYYANTK